MQMQPTASYRISHDENGMLYHFFCDLSGALVCTVRHVSGSGREEGLLSAWETEGKRHFSRCRKCGRWVSDTMYNPDTLRCVDCSPWEEQPAFCPQCGKRVVGDGMFCQSCHARLRYGEEVSEYPSTE